MFARTIELCSAALVAVGLIASSPAIAQTQFAAQAASQDGVIRVKSGYPLAETIARIKKDIAAKGITFFSEIDQSKLANAAGIALRPSTLLVFGNPALGSHFITANPAAGLDWPVRLLVTEDANGDAWAVYTDFAYIARRHGIASRDAQFNMASQVIASIVSSVAAK